MDSWKGLIIGFALIALVAYSIFNFAYITQVNNGVNNTILNEPVFASLNSTLSSNLQSLQVATNTQSNASLQEQGTLSNPSGALVLGSIFNSFSRFFLFLFGFGFTFVGLLGFLIQDTLITGVIFSIILITIIYSFWKLLKQGA